MPFKWLNLNLNAIHNYSYLLFIFSRIDILKILLSKSSSSISQILCHILTFPAQNDMVEKTCLKLLLTIICFPQHVLYLNYFPTSILVWLPVKLINLEAKGQCETGLRLSNLTTEIGMLSCSIHTFCSSTQCIHDNWKLNLDKVTFEQVFNILYYRGYF